MAAAAATSTAATVAATTASAASTFALRASLIHDQRAAEKFLSIQRRDRLFGFRVVFDFREAKPARLAGEAIAKQSERIGLHARFGKKRCHFLFRSLKRQITHVQFLHVGSPCAPPLQAGTYCEAEEAVLGPQGTTNAASPPG
jgi:hypothetical protein